MGPAVPMLLMETVMRLNGFIGGAFVAELPIMAPRMDPVIIARVAEKDCLRGQGEITFRVTREGRPYHDQARVFSFSSGTRPSEFAKALCAAGLKIVKPTH